MNRTGSRLTKAVTVMSDASHNIDLVPDMIIEQYIYYY
jgi:hypothetical protein